MAKKPGAPNIQALKDEVALLQIIEDSAREVNLSSERTAQLQERAADALERGAKAGKTAAQVQDEILATIEEQVAQERQLEKVQTRKQKLKQQQLKDDQTLKDLQDDLNSRLMAALKMDKATINQKHQELDLVKQNLKAAKEAGTITKEDYQDKMKVVAAQHQQLAAAQKFRDVIGDDAAKDLATTFDNAGQSVEQFTGGLIKSKDATKLIYKSVEKLGPGFLAALGPIILIIGAAKKLYEMMGEVNAQTREFSTQTGLSFQQSEKLVKSSMALATSRDNIMSTQQEILAVQGAVVQQFGIADAVSQKTVQSLSNMSKVLGISEQNAAGVQQVLMQNAGASEDAALGIQQMGAGLAEAYGVPINDAMQDLADSGEEVAKYFAGMPKEAMKTAVQLKAMGLNMKTAAKMADGLLDIETSIKAETKAQIMLGKSINLDKARQLAAQGRIAEAAAAATKEIGTAAEFAKMDQFQKKAAAEAAGLTLEELSKTYAMQEKIANMSEEQKAQVEKYGDKLGDVSQLNEDEIKAKVTALQGQEAMAASMDNMKTALTEILLPAMQMIGPIFQFIGKVISTAFQPFVFVASLIQKIISYVTQLSEQFTLLSTIFNVIKGFAIGIGAVLVATWLPTIWTFVTGIYASVAGMVSLAFSGIAAAIGPIFAAMSLFLGPFGIPVAIAAIATLGMLVNSFLDDGIVPPAGEGGPGYSRVLSGPEGSIAFNDKDTIVAGTDLGGGGGSAPAGGGGGGGSMDISPLVAAVQQTNALLAQMINSPSPVLIGDEALRKIGRNVKVQNSRGA
jgi:hypothetical protein